MNYFKFAVRALAGACACACVYAQYEVCMLCACLMHVHVPNPLCMTILHSRLAGDPDGDEAGSTRAFASANEQQRYVNEELYKVLEEVMLEAGLEDSTPLIIHSARLGDGQFKRQDSIPPGASAGGRRWQTSVRLPLRCAPPWKQGTDDPVSCRPTRNR